ncbi:hypothetical protein BLA29_011972 [Euroglyphus maynei]|uniref:Uncharacterized protein n=1 Tax=Euroglyphus maynei TaxID=6958 RepID=A0A1Y3BMI6_EURMA|nr:hypothetical protein BLA29_011972 [Euroglyphus maynei]
MEHPLNMNIIIIINGLIRINRYHQQLIMQGSKKKSIQVI